MWISFSSESPHWRSRPAFSPSWRKAGRGKSERSSVSIPPRASTAASLSPVLKPARRLFQESTATRTTCTRHRGRNSPTAASDNGNGSWRSKDWKITSFLQSEAEGRWIFHTIRRVSPVIFLRKTAKMPTNDWGQFYYCCCYCNFGF